MQGFRRNSVPNSNSLKANAATLRGLRSSLFAYSLPVPPDTATGGGIGGVEAFDGSKYREVTSSALQERLQEVLVLEILKDGGRNYLNLSVRSLYQHVLAAITNPPTVPLPAVNEDQRGEERSSTITTPNVEDNTTNGNPPPSSNSASPGLKSPVLSSSTYIDGTKPIVEPLLEPLPPPPAEVLQDTTTEVRATAISPPSCDLPPPPPLVTDRVSHIAPTSQDVIPTANGMAEPHPRYSPPKHVSLPPRPSSSSLTPENAGHSEREEMEISFQPSTQHEHEAASNPFYSPHPQKILRSSLKRLQPQVVNSFVRNKSVGRAAEETAAAVVTGQAGGVTYRERLGAYLHPRDMRKLVTPLSSSNEPDLIVRRHVMLLNYDPLRTIILRDRLLVLVPDGADSILSDLERRVRWGSKENVIFGKDDLAGTTKHKTLLGRVKKTAHRISGKSDRNMSNGGGASDDEDRRSQHGAIPRNFSACRLAGRDVLSNSEQPVGAGRQGQGVDLVVDNVPTSAPKGEDDGETFSLHASDEWADLTGREWIKLPFELQCTDAVLQTVVELLSKETLELEQATAAYIDEIINRSGGVYAKEDPLTIIRAIKDSVREMAARNKGFVQSMNRVLDDYEDMALMNLSRLLTHPELFIQPVPAEVLEEESDEPELILESFLQQGLSLVNAMGLIEGQINTAAELVDQKLDAARNKILLANTVITTIALCVDCAMVVSSMFGMNLTNHLEDSDSAFIKVTFWTLAGSVLLFFFTMFVMDRTGALPSWGSFSGSGF